MKKLLFGAAVLLLLANCSGKDDSQNKTLEKVESENMVDMVVDTETPDSLSAQTDNTKIAEEQYANAITLVPGKKKDFWDPGDESPYDETNIVWNCTVTNNSDVPLKANDYTISYKHIYFGDDFDRTLSKIRTIKGPDLNPGESKTITIDSRKLRSNTKDIKSPSVKLKISKEKFIERYKQSH